MDAGDAAKEYAAGFAAGVATVITGHPFDTVKVGAFPLLVYSLLFHSLLAFIYCSNLFKKWCPSFRKTLFGAIQNLPLFS